MLLKTALLWLIPLLAGSVAGLQGPPLAFDMEDQFRNRHRAEEYRGSIVVLIGSDRGGSDFNSRWSLALQEALEGEPGADRVRFLAFAHVRGVPFFVKGRVRDGFPKQPEAWVLLDWAGALYERYELVSDSSNLLVFDAAGQLVHRSAGRELEPGKLGAAAAAVRRLLAETEPP